MSDEIPEGAVEGFLKVSPRSLTTLNLFLTNTTHGGWRLGQTS